MLKYTKDLWLKVSKINISGGDAWLLCYYFRAVKFLRKALTAC